MSVAAMVHEFHRRLGDRLPEHAVPPSPDTAIRQRILDDEVAELREAWSTGDVVQIAHELADIVYVAYGTAARLGIPLDAVIAEIHRANMTKDPAPDGGKAIKGPGFRRADVAYVLDTAGLDTAD
jgi:predicted HAD superfamily Cof-like phosphohydrolase